MLAICKESHCTLERAEGGLALHLHGYMQGVGNRHIFTRSFCLLRTGTQPYRARSRSWTPDLVQHPSSILPTRIREFLQHATASTCQVEQQRAARQHSPSVPAPLCGRHACTNRRTQPQGASAHWSHSSHGYGRGGRRRPGTFGTGPHPTCRHREHHSRCYFLHAQTCGVVFRNAFEGEKNPLRVSKAGTSLSEQQNAGRSG